MRRYNRILKALSKGELETKRYWARRLAERYGYHIVPNDKMELDLNTLEWSCVFSVITDNMQNSFTCDMNEIERLCEKQWREK